LEHQGTLKVFGTRHDFSSMQHSFKGNIFCMMIGDVTHEMFLY
jgi:hypothetical protein